LRFDGIYDFGHFQTDPLCLYDELFHLMKQNAFAFSGAGARKVGYHGAYAGARFEKARLDEVLDHFVSRVGVYLQIGGEAAHRGKGLSGLKLSADESLDRGVDHLIEDRLAGAELEPEWCHIDTVTPDQPLVKSIVQYRPRYAIRSFSKELAERTRSGFRYFVIMAMRKMTFSVPEPLAEQFLLRVASRGRSRFVSEAVAARLHERDVALVRACEIANRDLDVAEIEKEFDGIGGEIAEPWK
jgi:hypothetical protein